MLHCCVEKESSVVDESDVDKSLFLERRDKAQALRESEVCFPACHHGPRGFWVMNSDTDVGRVQSFLRSPPLNTLEQPASGPGTSPKPITARLSRARRRGKSGHERTNGTAKSDQLPSLHTQSAIKGARNLFGVCFNMEDLFWRNCVDLQANYLDHRCLSARLFFYLSTALLFRPLYLNERYWFCSIFFFAYLIMDECKRMTYQGHSSPGDLFD